MRNVIQCIAFFLFSFVLLNCESKELSNQHSTVNEEALSRILNQSLKEDLPSFIQLRESLSKEMDNKPLSNALIHFLITEEFIYFHISSMDCFEGPFYQFKENNHFILIDSRSYQPERYFYLNNLEIIERAFDDVQICEDWFWLKGKYINIDNKLKLEKISTFFDNTYSETFYDKKDSAYLYKEGILMLEPEPTPN